VMLAPQSNEGGAWDVMVADFGPDVAMIDGMLSWVFDRFRMDPLRLAVAGFSNGATYSLSLGLTNGDLFFHVVAISPGGMLPDGLHGRPPVFVAHGTQDRTLPIDETSRCIVPQLRSLGYPLRYVEFEGRHTPVQPSCQGWRPWVKSRDLPLAQKRGVCGGISPSGIRLDT
jgi:phospholipase/carboxylesterase